MRTFAPSNLQTSMGDVYVYLPANLALTIDAATATASGSQIQSDFPLDIQGGKGAYVAAPLHGHGVLNGGGDVLTIRTVEGNIVIRKIDQASLQDLQQREENAEKAWEAQRAAKDRRNADRERAHQQRRTDGDGSNHEQ